MTQKALDPVTKATRFQIIKPLGDTTWQELGQVLRDLSYKTTKMCNAAVQLYWEHHNYRLMHKVETDKYPTAAQDKEKYGCSFRNHVYRHLRSMYPEVSSSNTSQTNQFVMNRWKNDVKEIMRLQKSIPSFRLGTPVQVANKNYTLLVEDTKGGGADFMVNVTLLSLASGKQTRYKILLDGGDRPKKTIFRQIVEGNYKQGAMQIKYNERKKKWFCIISFTFTPAKEDAKIDENKVMGLTLGTSEYAVYGAYNKNRKRFTIPVGEITAADRKIHAIKERRKNIQRHAGYQGQGHKRRLQGAGGLTGRSTNIKDTINHKYSYRIVNVAVANQCGKINILKPDLKHFWPWANLIDKIKYKAQERGVDVEIVELPTQKCYKCGTEIKNVEEGKLTCSKCEAIIDIDYNTAKLITKS